MQFTLTAHADWPRRQRRDLLSLVKRFKYEVFESSLNWRFKKEVKYFSYQVYQAKECFERSREHRYPREERPRFPRERRGGGTIGLLTEHEGRWNDRDRDFDDYNDGYERSGRYCRFKKRKIRYAWNEIEHDFYNQRSSRHEYRLSHLVDQISDLFNRSIDF